MFNGKCWTIRTSDASRIRDLQASQDGLAIPSLYLNIHSCGVVRHWRTMFHAVYRDSRVYRSASAAS